MSRNSKRGFSPWALATLILIGVCSPARAQVHPDGGLPGGVLPAAPNGQQAEAPPRPEATSEMLVFLQPGTDPRQFAREHGVLIQYALRSDPNAYVVRAASPLHATAAHAAMARDLRVRAAYPNRHTYMQKTTFTPNDPYFHKNTPAAGWPGQWHLYNELTPGLDARVMGAWNRDITGQGVVIGIVDDCLERTHPDLAPNYVAADSWDFGQNDPDPAPFYSSDMHGTSVAGVAAARGGNGIGGTGAAPLAGLAGLRCDFSSWFQTDAMFVDATLYHSSGANTHIKVKNHSYSNKIEYSPSQAQADALAVSTAAGTIHCFSAGNGRDFWGADANQAQPQNSPDSITVAAMGSSGLFATYSSYGANVFVTAPSSSDRSTGYLQFEFSVTTTDRTGLYGYCPVLGFDHFPDENYTSVFGGTSSASPLVAGVMALGKQAQPNLNTRFAKHLLAITSDVVDPNDSTIEGDGDGVTPGSAWRKNAAGYLFNQNYGMGLINADAFTKLATQCSGVTPLQVEDTGLMNVGAAIPDNSQTGVRRTFSINSTTPLEEMLLTLDVTHEYHGDVEAYLTSPSGTRARVMRSFSHWNPYPDGSERDIHWTFCVNTFWGENPHGTWTLEVKDVRAGNVGTLDSFAATARMGTLVVKSNTSVTVNNVAAAIGQTIPLSATLRRTGDNLALYGGTLTFKVNGTVIGTAVTNSKGVATRSYRIPDTLGLGNKTITVDYGGNTYYNSSSGKGALTVNKTNTTLAAPTVSGHNGQAVTLSATLKRATDGVALYGGTLTFKVDGVVVGTAVTSANGVGARNYTIPTTMTVGTHAITVSFAGSGYYFGSTGTGTLTVQ